METLIGDFIKEDMNRRAMTIREYAQFINSTHPTVAKYMNGTIKHVQWEFVVNLSRATKTDIGTLARLIAPDAAFEPIPDSRIIAERINQLPTSLRKSIIEMIDALLAQQQRDKHVK